MTADDFRTLALALPETAEASHMNHPDFRVGGKIFATLGYPTTAWGALKLTPTQQQRLVRQAPRTFVAVKGTWGKRGATAVYLRGARKTMVEDALRQAWANTAPKRLVRAHVRAALDQVNAPRPARSG